MAVYVVCRGGGSNGREARLLLVAGYSHGSPGIFKRSRWNEKEKEKEREAGCEYQEPERGVLLLPVRAMSTVASESLRTNIFAEARRHMED